MTDIKVYGQHLMIDAYGADAAKLDDPALLFETLDQLPAMVGMKKLSTPMLARVADPGGEGISGIIMIFESHISIHTYPKKDFFSMDLYSCKSFDVGLVVDEMKRRYGTDDMEINVIERAKRFPVFNLHG